MSSSDSERDIDRGSSPAPATLDMKLPGIEDQEEAYDADICTNASAEDEKASDASDGVDLSGLYKEKWYQIMTAESSDSNNSPPFKHLLKCRRVDRDETSSIADTEVEEAAHANPVTFSVDNPTAENFGEMVKERPTRCMAQSLISLKNRYLTRSLALCSNCALCKALKAIRASPNAKDGEAIPPEEDRVNASQFWVELDARINRIFGSESQGNSGYPVTQMLHRGAILDHPLMQESNSKLTFDFLAAHNVPLSQKTDEAPNVIETEELGLSLALLFTAGHYSDLTFESKAQSKLEALDVIENITKSLRILWEAEFDCRKAVWAEVMV